MRKIYFVLVISFLVVSVSTNAQSEKKEPPRPPPPKPKVIVNETVNASKPKEPPVITITGDLADKFLNETHLLRAYQEKETLPQSKRKMERPKNMI